MTRLFGACALALACLTLAACGKLGGSLETSLGAIAGATAAGGSSTPAISGSVTELTATDEKAEKARAVVCRYQPIAKIAYASFGGVFVPAKYRPSVEQAFAVIDGGCSTPPGSKIRAVAVDMLRAWLVLEQRGVVSQPQQVALRRAIRVREAR